jgi:hypothetical protein
MATQMKIITTGENLRPLGFGALDDLFCVLEFFDPISLKLRPSKRRPASECNDNAFKLNTPSLRFALSVHRTGDEREWAWGKGVAKAVDEAQAFSREQP